VERIYYTLLQIYVTDGNFYGSIFLLLVAGCRLLVDSKQPFGAERAHSNQQPATSNLQPVTVNK
jgi:hypothetical protein